MHNNHNYSGQCYSALSAMVWLIVHYSIRWKTEEPSGLCEKLEQNQCS